MYSSHLNFPFNDGTLVKRCWVCWW